MIRRALYTLAELVAAVFIVSAPVWLSFLACGAGYTCHP